MVVYCGADILLGVKIIVEKFQLPGWRPALWESFSCPVGVLPGWRPARLANKVFIKACIFGNGDFFWSRSLTARLFVTNFLS
jgi:hypothetical protein